MTNLPENSENPKNPNSIKSFEIAHYSGPIPPPNLLQAYENIVPGLADRIMKLTENQSNHRIQIESIVIPNREKQSTRGQIFAITIGLFGLACATFLIYTDHDTAGTIIGGTTLVSLVSAFLFGSRGQQKDLSKKRPENKK